MLPRTTTTLTFNRHFRSFSYTYSTKFGMGLFVSLPPPLRQSTLVPNDSRAQFVFLCPASRCVVDVEKISFCLSFRVVGATWRTASAT